MKILNKALLFGLGLLFITRLSLAQEPIITHFDKPYYASGEVMWYKVYLPKFFENNDVTLKVIVSDEQGVKKDSYFVQSEGNNFLTSYYKIPFTMSSGIYQFHFYALTKITDREVLLTNFEIPVYNDLQENQIEIAEKVTYKSNSEFNSAALSIDIRTDKDVYHPQEEMRMRLNIKDANGQTLQGNFSVSIIDESLIGNNWSNHTVSTTLTDQLDAEVINYLDNSLYIKGKVYDPEKNPLRINQMGVYDGQNNTMHLSRTNDNGEFALFLPVLYGKRELQFEGYISNEAPQINVDLNDDRQPSTNTKIQCDDDILTYLAMSRTRKKIYQYYKSLEYDLALEKISDDVRSIKADNTYDIEKFVDFPTIGAFFDEILSAPLSFSQKGDQIVATMFDKEAFRRFSRSGGSNTNFIFDPIFIIDGKMTKNAGHVYKMDLNGVETIELYNVRSSLAKLLGNFRNYGVVLINTSLPEVTLPIEDEQDIKKFNGIQPKTSFTEMKSFQKDIPQLRPLLYWNPEVSSAENGNADIITRTSHDIAKLKIIAVGQTKDGRIAKGSASVEVKHSVVSNN